MEQKCNSIGHTIIILIGFYGDVYSQSINNWQAWGPSSTGGMIGHSTQSFYYTTGSTTAEEACVSSGGISVSRFHPEIISNPNSFKAFMMSVNYDQIYWIADYSGSGSCPGVKYKDNQVRYVTASCNSMMNRVICTKDWPPAGTTTAENITTETTVAESTTTETTTAESTTTETTTAESTTTETTTTETTTTETTTAESTTTETTTTETTTTAHPSPNSQADTTQQLIHTTELSSISSDTSTRDQPVASVTNFTSGEVPDISTTDVPIKTTLDDGMESLIPFDGKIEWTVWLPWTECTAQCGGGEQLRIRFCEGVNTVCQTDFASLRGIKLTYDIEVNVCNNQTCPMNGVWMEWGPWENCTECETIHFRHRQCAEPTYGGKPCEGSHYELGYCDVDTEACDELDRVQREELSDEGPPFKVSDSRPSAITTGSIAIIFIAIELVLLALADALTCGQHIRYCMRSLHPRTRRVRPAAVVTEVENFEPPTPPPESEKESYETELLKQVEEYDDYFRN